MYSLLPEFPYLSKRKVNETNVLLTVQLILYDIQQQFFARKREHQVQDQLQAIPLNISKHRFTMQWVNW